VTTPLLAPQTSANPVRPPIDFGWDRLDMWFVTQAGDRFELSEWATGAFLMPGVTGMSMPKINHQTLSYANAHGNVWNGLLIEPREVFWPLYLYNDETSQGYVDHIRAFWEALSPFETVRWHVRDVTGTERYLDVRLKDDGGPGNDHDDVYYGWSKHRVVLEAHQPMWRSVVPIQRPFEESGGVKFFGPAGNNGPPFRPSRNSAAGTAALPNDGDLPAYVTWELVGPLNPATLSHGGHVIDVPFVINQGQTVVIDTNPESLTAFRNGVEITELMTGRFDAAPIPRKATTALQVEYGGDGSITASITPSYMRAYA